LALFRTDPARRGIAMITDGNCRPFRIAFKLVTMLDLQKAIGYLRSELAEVRRLIDAMESMAAKRRPAARKGRTTGTAATRKTTARKRTARKEPGNAAPSRASRH
jgi:hypothetical protein